MHVGRDAKHARQRDKYTFQDINRADGEPNVGIQASFDAHDRSTKLLLATFSKEVFFRCNLAARNKLAPNYLQILWQHIIQCYIGQNMILFGSK